MERQWEFALWILLMYSDCILSNISPETHESTSPVRTTGGNVNAVNREGESSLFFLEYLPYIGHF